MAQSPPLLTPLLSRLPDPVPARAQVQRFDDKNETLMTSFGEQIRLVHDADVVIGAHGAALSHLMYARPGCSAAISIRNRGNSDIFSHLAIAAGVEFHHVLWRYDM